MKIWMGVIVFAGLVSAVDGAAQCVAGPGHIALFKDSNYRGSCRMIAAGSYASMKAVAMDNDAISSIRIGPGMQARLCENTNYGGTCQTFTADHANFSGTAIGHDRTSSFKVGPASVPFTCTPGPNQVAIFEHDTFRGGCAVLDMGNYPEDHHLGLTNDTVSSVQVGAAAEVLLCRDERFLGDCELFTAARANMSGTRLGHDRVSSLVVRPRGTKSCVPGPNEVSIYRHTAYEGTCVVKPIGEYPTAATMNIANDEVSSARVGAGVQLVACRNEQFTDCQVLTQDTPDFGRTGIGHDRLSSMKVQPAGQQDCTTGANQASFYRNASFVGPCSTRGLGNYPNAAAFGLPNDSIRSIRMASGVRVCGCEHDNFLGRCTSYLGDTALSDPGISSLRVLPRDGTECFVPVTSGVREVEITNCDRSQRPMELRINYITRLGEGFFEPAGLATSGWNGVTCNAFGVTVGIPHGVAVRVIAVDYTNPSCPQPCIRADTGVIVGYNLGEVKRLTVQ